MDLLLQSIFMKALKQISKIILFILKEEASVANLPCQILFNPVIIAPLQTQGHLKIYLQPLTQQAEDFCLHCHLKTLFFMIGLKYTSTIVTGTNMQVIDKIRLCTKTSQFTLGGAGM